MNRDDDDGYPDVTEIPRLADPRWPAWVAPLSAFLKTARTWEELQIWRLQQKIAETVFINLLAWLSFHGRAGTTTKQNWVASLKPERNGRRPPKPEHAGSNPAGDTNVSDHHIPAV
jgi:hypothetical protein